ncbi:MAG: 3-isopropylmalate dehydratase small subunit [Candidatus Altiarchaeales archaeon IMC4]|nr:MAG: 3-isopropylmalate dehydratase small subunit [Candidatus Altiarchaeales archaeon IMC4]
MNQKIKGRVWRFAENVDTDQIIPAEYLVTGDARELAKYAFEKVRPEFAGRVKPGDIIVAGDNFGCGSSREHAPRALIGCGVSCVIAKSFARIFFRNSINIGLPLVECGIEAKDGDEIEVDFTKGTVKNLTDMKECNFSPMPPFLLKLIDAGGLVGYVKKGLKK